MKFSIFLALLPVSRFSSKNDPNYTLLETLQLKTYTLVANTMTEKAYTEIFLQECIYYYVLFTLYQ